MEFWEACNVQPLNPYCKLLAFVKALLDGCTFLHYTCKANHGLRVILLSLQS